MVRTVIACAALGLLVGGCSSSGPKVVSEASAERRGTTLDQIKQLAGEWQTKDDKGQAVTAAVFTVASNGTAVREVMFPGSGHEMTNMYHMNGNDLMMVHYCAMGNQPHLKALSATPGQIVFGMDSVSNFTSAHELYMGGLTLTWKDANTVVANWTSYKDGKADDKHTVFEMTRKRT